MTLTSEFDALCRQVSKGLRLNQEAHVIYADSMAQAERTHEVRLEEAKTKYDRDSTSGSSQLRDVTEFLSSSSLLIRRAQIHVHEPITDTKTYRQKMLPQIGLEQAWKQSENALQSVKRSCLELELIRREKEESRHTIRVTIFAGVLLGIMIFFAYQVIGQRIGAEATLTPGGLRSPAEFTQSLTGASSSTQIYDAIVNVDRLNVRTGPGTLFGIATTIPRGRVVVLIGRNADGTWLQIEGTSEGWVFAELLQVPDDVMSLPITTAEISD